MVGGVERWQATISTADSFQYFSGFDDIHCTKFWWYYGWSPTENMAFNTNNSSGIFNPFAKAHCVGAQCSVVRVDPPMPTRDQMADFAGFFATQAGWIGSTAAMAGAIPGPHTLAAEGTALFATLVGFGAGGVEQILRPNAKNIGVDGTIDLINYYISEKNQLLSPITNGVGEAIKGSDWANSLKKSNK